MNIFYATDIAEGQIHFPQDEAVHCGQVLRHQPGDAINVVDGQGNWYEAEITEMGKKKLTARVIRQTAGYGQLPWSVHLAVAPTKNINRFEWLLEKATEIGVASITPLLCERSERRRLRLDRLERVIIAAMKQSLKAYLPHLHELTPLPDFIDAQRSFSGQKFMAYIDENVNTSLQQNYRAGQDVCLLIGPEGDFSPQEVTLARETGFAPVSLGRSRLRTETAGVLACYAVHMLNE